MIFGYSSKKSLALSIAFIAIALCGGFVGGWFLSIRYQSKNHPEDDTRFLQPLREQHSSYKFIGPLLACITDKKTLGEYTPFEKDLLSIIDDRRATGAVTDVSVYYRNLNTGRWVGINEEKKFSPASLLKVPIMIAYFKIAESNPTILDEQIRYASGPDINAQESIKPSESIHRGAVYTIDQLIRAMIVSSDNNAATLLFNHLDKNIFQEVGADLGVDISATEEGPDFMSVRSYALFFRILYNASYLSRDLSEKALALLSESEFHDGIVAGVPGDISVSHKFGERQIRTDGTIVMNELHDCGVVYNPTNPYLLCVMTSGHDTKAQASVIAELSRVIFEGLKK